MNFELTRIGEEFFEPVIIGNFKISIQASQWHYSKPRKTLASSNDYTDFEVSLTYDNQEFCPLNHYRLCHYDWAKSWSKKDCIAILNRHQVQQLIDDLKGYYEEGKARSVQV